MGLPLLLGIVTYILIIIVLTVWLKSYHHHKSRILEENVNWPEPPAIEEGNFNGALRNFKASEKEKDSLTAVNSSDQPTAKK